MRMADMRLIERARSNMLIGVQSVLSRAVQMQASDLVTYPANES